MSSEESNKRTRRVMLDIETVGLEIGAAIVEIGAVQFAPGGQIGETFHRSVSLTSSQEAGLNIDADTVEWWLGEQPEVASEVLVGGEHLRDALTAFVAWYEDVDPSEVWANSPSFDCEQLEYAGQAVGVPMPWEFYQERDVRTLDALPHSVNLDQQGTEHTALDDALYQARVAGEILAELGESKEVAL
jgi:DNA polymerase III epsilon subunit-like protein